LPAEFAQRLALRRDARAPRQLRRADLGQRYPALVYLVPFLGTQTGHALVRFTSEHQSKVRNNMPSR